jgi:hypothetical protein
MQLDKLIEGNETTEDILIIARSYKGLLVMKKVRAPLPSSDIEFPLTCDPGKVFSCSSVLGPLHAPAVLSATTL